MGSCMSTGSNGLTRTYNNEAIAALATLHYANAVDYNDNDTSYDGDCYSGGDGGFAFSDS